MKLSTRQLLMFAGLFTWACVGLFLMFAPWLDGADTSTEYPMWLLPYLAFGAAYWKLVRDMETRQTLRERILLLVLMTICALEVSHMSHSGVGRILLLVVAGVLPWTVPLPVGVGWLVGQNIAHAFVIGFIPGVRWAQAVVLFGLYLGFSSFAFVMSLVGRRQSEARRELRKVNSELRATQALLAESTRIAERVRISRELHDLVGHHLTALSLNLEVASHLVTGKAVDHVAQAQTVAKLLLSDVREVVGAMRGDDHIDLTEALLSLTEGVPRPKVHMQIPQHLKVEDPQRAQVVLRCTQEIITNTVKHANADNLWLNIDQSDDGLSIHARDDGRGTDKVDAGNGLRGMGERLRQLGGKLSINSNSGQGFRLDAWLPREVVI